MVNSAQQTGHT